MQGCIPASPLNNRSASVPIDKAQLVRAHEFHYSLRRELIGETERAIPPSDRNNAAYSYCKIGLEHGAGFQMLLGDDNPTSALAIVRLQYEAVLRCAWIVFAASDDWVEKFSARPTSNEGKEPAEFLRVFEMLEQLQRSKADPMIHLSLSTLKEKAWDSLNSYTHGGLRLMIRSLEGFEDELLLWMLRTTNSLSYMSSQLLAFVANDPACSHRLNSVRKAMPDCMHT